MSTDKYVFTLCTLLAMTPLVTVFFIVKFPKENAGGVTMEECAEACSPRAPDIRGKVCYCDDSAKLPEVK